MEGMLDTLDEQNLDKTRTRPLKKFYESVRLRVDGIDNAEGKQKIITELYDTFFTPAFPEPPTRSASSTPRSRSSTSSSAASTTCSRSEFGASLTDEGVHILDPFTGTGTFMVRLLQSG